jgi:hypothetical protein
MKLKEAKLLNEKLTEAILAAESLGANEIHLAAIGLARVDRSAEERNEAIAAAGATAAAEDDKDNG